MIIFLDESGQFTPKDHDQYFVVGTFTTGDPRRTEKRFRSWQRTKFPRHMRHQPEIKFSNIDIDASLRFSTLRAIANLDVRVHFSYLKRQNIPTDYREGDRIKSGHLYTNIISETLEQYLPISDKEFRVFCDERHLKGLKRSEFKNIIQSALLPQLPKGSLVQIEMIDSIRNANIQIADWISGALAKYLNGDPYGQEYHSILKNNLLGEGKEMFKEYWSTKFVSKNST
jgi:hypothetical protein